MKQGYTTVRLPKDFRRSADIVRSKMAQRGLSNLPMEFRDGLADRYCPFCHLEMVPSLHFKMAHTCPECKFSKPVFEVTTPTAQADELLRTVGIAAFIGLGIYLAAKVSSGEKE